MPTIMPIRDLKNTSEISKLAHNIEDTFQIDNAIEKVEEDIRKGDKGKPAREVIDRLNRKYYGKI